MDSESARRLQKGVKGYHGTWGIQTEEKSWLKTPVKPLSRTRAQSLLRRPLLRCDWIPRSVPMMPHHPLHKLKQNQAKVLYYGDRGVQDILQRGLRNTVLLSVHEFLYHLVLSYVLTCRKYCHLKREELSCLHLIWRHCEHIGVRARIQSVIVILNYTCICVSSIYLFSLSTLEGSAGLACCSTEYISFSERFGSTLELYMITAYCYC